jgi:hypothetical protein
MIGWFRRRPKQARQPPKPDGWDDRHVAAAHGIPLNIWVTITPERKAELRASVVAALNERNNAA